MNSSFPKRYTFGGLGALFLWSLTFAFARSLSEAVGPLTAGAAVYLIGGGLCLGRVCSRGNPGAWLRDLPRRYLLGCGGLFLFYTAAIYLAVGLARNREQMLEIALVNYLWPALTIAFSIPLLKQRGRWWLWPGTALALVGVFLVMTEGAQVSWTAFARHVRSNPAAYALGLSAALAWALYSNLARRWSRPAGEGGVELFVPATGLVLLAMCLVAAERSVWNLRAVGEAALMGAVTALAYVLWDAAMRKGDHKLVATCSYFTPLLSTLVSWAYLGVSPGPRLWSGCLVLVGGSLVTWWAISTPPNSSEAGPRCAGPARTTELRK